MSCSLSSDELLPLIRDSASALRYQHAEARAREGCLAVSTRKGCIRSTAYSGVAGGGGGGGGAKGAIAPPFFQGERVGGRAIYHVVTLGDEQTRQGTGYGD